MKLLFETIGMSLSQENPISCRMRTRLKHANGRVVYLEISGIEIDRTKPKQYDRTMFESGHQCCGMITHAFYVREDGEESDIVRFADGERDKPYSYDEEGILNIVNTLLGTQYTELAYTQQCVHETRDCLC